MKLWTTSIKAIDPYTEQMKNWCGPNVPGINKADAEFYCELNGLGYCKVVGELIAEIPCNKNCEPDFSKMIDYEKINQN